MYVVLPHVSCNTGGTAIHYSAPLARRSEKAAAPAVTGQPGIHESSRMYSVD
ncbi:Hypothetical predicted protein [Scomber scombrus]|uniref:Uncharacterized protein n=1 Tax=Scomber scombrus TaxID=13677 RepID=A0AAV1P437_SCOSC